MELRAELSLQLSSFLLSELLVQLPHAHLPFSSLILEKFQVLRFPPLQITSGSVLRECFLQVGVRKVQKFFEILCKFISAL